MKNKKGFTLVELLAVIVILGVLLLVAIPAVSTVITNSRKGADRDEAIEFLNAIENCTLSNGNVEVCAVADSSTLLKGNFKGYYDPTCSAGDTDCTRVDGDDIYLKNFAFVGANGYAVYYDNATTTVSNLKKLINEGKNGDYGTTAVSSVAPGSGETTPAVKGSLKLN